MRQRYDEIFLSNLNPKAQIFIPCPNKSVGYSSVNLNLKADISQTIPSNISFDVEDRAIISHDNKGRMNTCLSISQVETRYERSTFILYEMIGRLCVCFGIIHISGHKNYPQY